MNEQRIKAIHKYLIEYKEDSGLVPTRRQIAEGTDIPLSMVNYYLQEMRKRGMVDWNDGLARTLRITT